MKLAPNQSTMLANFTPSIQLVNVQMQADTGLILVHLFI